MAIRSRKFPSLSVNGWATVCGANGCWKALFMLAINI